MADRREVFRVLQLVREPEAIPTLAHGTVRADNRADTEIRALTLKTGVLPNATGSAHVELGETKVLCTISGPQQADGQEFLNHGKLECTVRFTAFARREEAAGASIAAGSGSGSTADAEGITLAASLMVALNGSVRLDQYPKSVIIVNAMVLQDAGSVLPALVCCASLALGHAGIQLYGLVACCSCAIGGEGRSAIDPSAAEERGATGLLIAAIVPELSHLTLLHEEGRIAFESMTGGLRSVLDGCASLHERMKTALTEQAAAAAGSARGKRRRSSVSSAAALENGGREAVPE
jgi:exosome complex component MTR3